MKKKLELFGKKLTKNEMKKVNGGKLTCGGIPCNIPNQPDPCNCMPCMEVPGQGYYACGGWGIGW